MALSNSGQASFVISSIGLQGSDFSISGIATPLTLMGGQSANFSVKFSPTGTGMETGMITIFSDAANSTMTVGLSGIASNSPPTKHSATLTWTPSTSAVVGYNVYRGMDLTGPFSRLNSSLVQSPFTDTTVQAGQTYFFVVTAVDAVGRESAFSSPPVQATIPTP